MDPRRHRRILRFAPELIFILAAVIDVIWMSLAGLGLVVPAPSMPLGIPAYVVFALAMVAVLARTTELGQRIMKLEQLLAADEADIAALSELPIALHPPGLVVGGGMREPAAGPSSSSGISSAGARLKGPIEAGVEDAIAGYRLAGYTADEAEALTREALRMQVKEAGGWSP